MTPGRCSITRARLFIFDSLKARLLITTSFTHAQTFDCYVYSAVHRDPLFCFYHTLSSYVIYS